MTGRVATPGPTTVPTPGTTAVVPAPAPTASVATPAPTAVPTATYRVQLTPQSGFDRLAASAPYLAELGVSHAYLSPVLASAPGSLHGYDVVDHGRVDDELGGEEGLRSAAAALAERGIGIVLDLVPNHMALAVPEYLNRPLWSVLRDGADSPCRAWFDVDWSSRQPFLLPVLGGRIDEVMDAGDLRLDPHGPDGEPVLRYFEHAFPLRPGTAELPLEELLDAQHYRLAHWRVAAEELNYRRFFDVDTLVAIRVEDPDVFAQSHRLPMRLLRDGLVQGLRIDHPDGLADPRGYLHRLAESSGGAWTVAEKILEPEEVLPADWDCAGTTGYDALLRIGALFVDPAGQPVMTAAFAEDTGVTASWAETADEARRDVLSDLLVAEVDRLAGVAHEVCQSEVRLRDHSRRGLTEAVTELLAAVPVYRAYVTPGEPPSAAAVSVLEGAAAAATSRRPEREAEIAVVLALALGRLGRSDRKDEFCVRFQQTTGPAMAKGVEDTACYRWFPLSSLCEVGGRPDTWGTAPWEFHAWAEQRRRDWPTTVNATSTHDNKRNEDVRARLAVLSEIAGEWVTSVRAWREAAGPLQCPGGGSDGRTEWLAWQTIVGTAPWGGGLADPTRIGSYLVKAAREAKDRTSWTAPDDEYEKALAEWVERVLADDDVVASIGQLLDRIAPGTVANVLGQRTVHATMPGVPDVYAGCETVSLRLVDPDNRVAVDSLALADSLTRARAARPDPARDLPGAKLSLTATLLGLRRERPDLLGPQQPHVGVDASGPAADHCLAFRRGADVLVAASRFALRLAAAGGWGGTAIPVPRGRWHDVVTGENRESDGEVAVSELLASWPVAVLVRT